MDGIVGGVGSVIVFLPNILILFLGISFLEDSGYMARAAFLMDRVMHALGLHGKSFIPMLMGFGCSVPAIMATRTLESRRDRVLTMLLIPLMSCSARFPVYLLIGGAFFGERAGTVVFVVYLSGIVAAILLGRLLAKTMFRSSPEPFVMELPPYRLPTPKGLSIHMWERAKLYLQKMGGVILVASVVLWFLGAFPRDEALRARYETDVAALRAVGDPRGRRPGRPPRGGAGLEGDRGLLRRPHRARDRPGHGAARLHVGDGRQPRDGVRGEGGHRLDARRASITPRPAAGSPGSRSPGRSGTRPAASPRSRPSPS